MLMKRIYFKYLFIALERFLLNQQFRFCIFFANNLGLKEIVYCSKRPIGVFFMLFHVKK